MIQPRVSPCQGKTVALQLPERGEKSDSGEDLTCRGSCFVWKSPRRQVANRVTASPWKQTIRPYHLPKLQPIVLQPHVDDVSAVSVFHSILSHDRLAHCELTLRETDCESS